jgi:hypothetical protein
LLHRFAPVLIEVIEVLQKISDSLFFHHYVLVEDEFDWEAAAMQIRAHDK